MASSLDVQLSALCNSCPVTALLMEQSKRIAELEAMLATQAKEIKDLKSKLSVYENPYTPSSAQRFKANPKGHFGNKKHGAPMGRKGATRPRPEPTEFVHVYSDRCERCGCENLELIGTDPAVREDIVWS